MSTYSTEQPGPKVYLGLDGPEPSGPLPRYITVTPDEGAIITIAVPWAQIEAAVHAAGYEIVPLAPLPERKRVA
jgi:hypothetical protein